MNWDTERTSIEVESDGQLYVVAFTLRTRVGMSDFGDGLERHADADAEFDGPIVIERYVGDTNDTEKVPEPIPFGLARTIHGAIKGYVEHARASLI